MTVFNSPGVAAKISSFTHGESRSTNRLHELIFLPSTLATGDTINIGFLPPNAVVSSLTLKAQSQLDAGSTPTLAIDVGLGGNAQLFNAASSVGRSAGSSVDLTVLPAGRLYKGSTGAKQVVFATVHSGAATPLAGVLEVELSYFVEEPAGSPA